MGDLPEFVRAAAAKMGWNQLVPVQAKAIPYVLARRDMMVQARTGSGKTGAFLMPAMAMIDAKAPACQVLVLVPTRELALQVSREAEALCEGTGVASLPVYGGVSYGPQLEGFRKGAHIVIGTPGRILDHIVKGSLELGRLRILVFDEADRMMSMGFYPDMRQIQRYLPRQRSGYMFSATFPPMVHGLAGEFLREPGFLSLSHDRVHVEEIEHVYFEVPAMEKDRALVRILEIENPASAIIFCNRREKVNYVATVLQRFGYDADQLTSDLSQNARERVLERLRGEKLRFLVATDVAARGIDIAGLSHVFLYEFPEDLESYIHRVGRTGRAGAGGVAISLVTLQEAADLARVARSYNIELEKRELPTNEDVENMVSQRVVALLESKARDRDRLQVERMRRFFPLAKALAETDDEVALLAMLIDDYYQQILHAPPPAPEGGEHARRASPSIRRQGGHRPDPGDQPGSSRPRGRRSGRGRH